MIKKIANPKRSNSEWFEIFERCKSSKLPIEHFCKKEGISLTCYYKHRNRLEGNKEIKFLEIEPKKTCHKSLSLEIRFNNLEFIFNVGSR